MASDDNEEPGPADLAWQALNTALLRFRRYKARVASAGGGRSRPQVDGWPPWAFVWRRSVAWAALAGLIVLSTALIWSWSSNQTLLGDVQGYAYRTSTVSVTEFMFNPPPGKHLIAVPLLLYKAAFEGFGISSFVPYRVAHIFLLVLCALLFYALARRRVGDTLAVLPTGIMLFLGSGWEVVASPLRDPSLIAIAAGLGMLLALERRDLRGDVAAFGLLTLSLASHSTSFAFAAASAVLVLARPSPARWRSAWVFVLPVLAYATWWVLEFDPGPSDSLASRVAGIPLFLGRSLIDTLVAASGLFKDTPFTQLALPGRLEAVRGAALLLLLAVVVFARFRTRRPISAFTCALVAALITLWIATGLAPGPARPPLASRYLYPYVLLFLLLLCELGRDFELPQKLTAPVAIAIAIAFVVSIAGNLYDLRIQERAVDATSDSQRAALTALALESRHVPPDFSIFDALSGRVPKQNVVTKLPYAALEEALAAYGSPAYNAAELASRPRTVRLNADYVSLRAADSGLLPSSVRQPTQGRAPRTLSVSGGSLAATSPGCVALRPSATIARATFSLPSNGLALSVSPGAPANVSAGRFADDTPLSLGAVPGGHNAVLSLPASRLAQPWRVGIESGQRVLACSL